MSYFSPESQSGYFLLQVPTIAAAAAEVHVNTRIAPRLVLSQALAAVSLACQSRVVVKLPDGNISPTHLMLLNVAGSGQGKTASFKPFFRRAREKQNLRRDRHDEYVANFKGSVASWKKKARILTNKLELLTKTEGDVTSTVAEIQAHVLDEPKFPVPVDFIFSDTTIPAMLQRMCTGQRSGILAASEGGIILKGQAFRDLAKLNAIFSDEELEIHRKSEPTLIVRGLRLTVSISVQPDILFAVIKNRKDELRGSGNLARFLVFDVSDQQAPRPFAGEPMGWPACDAFSERIDVLLGPDDVPTQEPAPALRVLTFDPLAKERWVAYYNAVQFECFPDKQYSGAVDHASRLPEIVGRLAANFHEFEGFEGNEISLATLEAAISVVDDCARDFVRLFVPIPQVVLDAEMLDLWFEAKRSPANPDRRKYSKAEGRRKCPNPIRNPRYFEALTLLCRRGRVREYPGANGAVLLDLLPNLPPDPVIIVDPNAPKIPSI